MNTLQVVRNYIRKLTQPQDMSTTPSKSDGVGIACSLDDMDCLINNLEANIELVEAQARSNSTTMHRHPCRIEDAFDHVSHALKTKLGIDG